MDGGKNHSRAAERIDPDSKSRKDKTKKHAQPRPHETPSALSKILSACFLGCSSLLISIVAKILLTNFKYFYVCTHRYFMSEVKVKVKRILSKQNVSFYILARKQWKKNVSLLMLVNKQTASFEQFMLNSWKGPKQSCPSAKQTDLTENFQKKKINSSNLC